MRKKIAVALAAGVAFGTMFAAPVAASVAEAASSESVLKLKSPAETFATQGDKLYAERKYAEAGEAYKKAAEEDEKNDQYWFQAGISFQNAGKPHSAADCFKKAVKLQPNNGIYNKWLGVAYWAQTSNPGGTSTDTLQERAMKYTGRAAELLPNDIDAQATAGVIEEAVGDSVRIQSRSGWFMVFPGAIERHFKKAYQYYRRAVEIDPSKTENIDRLNRFVSTHSEYGFQPYNPIPQSTPETAGGNEPSTNSNTGAKAYLPANYSVEGGVAFTPLGYYRGWAEVYRNPYKDGGEYVVISGWFDDREGKCFDPYETEFDYDPETGEFYFTGGCLRLNDGNEYYMKAHVINETTVGIEWLRGNRNNGPENAARESQETLTLQSSKKATFRYSRADGGPETDTDYVFVDVKGEFNVDIAAAIGAMYAFLDFIEAGGEVGDPPNGAYIPHGSKDNLKHPEMYRYREN